MRIFPQAGAAGRLYTHPGAPAGAAWFLAMLPTLGKSRVRAGPGTPPSGEAELKGPHAGRAALGGVPQGERPPAAVVCWCWWWWWCWCCCAPPRAAPGTCHCRLAEGSSFTSVTNRHGSLRCTAPRRRIAPPRRAAPTAAAGPAAKCARAALPPHPSLLAVSHGKCSPGCRRFSPSVWGDAEARAAAAVGGTAAAAAPPGFGTWCGPRGADTSCLPSPPPDVCCFVCLFFLLPKERQIAYTSGVASALA